MNKTQLCMGCMQPKGRESVCPECGYTKTNRSPMVLPYQAMLNNKFLVGRILGKPGGFGVTYLAWDTLLHTRVAIKEYFPANLASRSLDHCTVELYNDKDRQKFELGLDKFLREARILAQFSHPNVVRVRDIFQQNDTTYLVMDYYEGVQLEEFVQKKGNKISESLALNIMLPILDGLGEVHKKKVLHRDIKPANIYLTTDNVPILLDFGAARIAIGQSSHTLSVVLTAGFAPFEQYLDNPEGLLGPWTDIYACGATLYAITTGVLPQNPLDRHQKDELKAPHLIEPKLSRQFSRAIMAALALEPENRPQSADAFQDLLLSAVPMFVPSLTESSAQRESAPKERQPLPVAPLPDPLYDEPTRAMPEPPVSRPAYRSQSASASARPASPSAQPSAAKTGNSKQTTTVRCPYCNSRNTITSSEGGYNKIQCHHCGKIRLYLV